MKWLNILLLRYRPLKLKILILQSFHQLASSDNEYDINNEISAIKLKDIVANEMVNVYLERLEKLEIGKFSTVIDYDNQFSVLVM